MRTYIPEEKREYEKIYEATTGKVSHKILIELDEQTDAYVRGLAEKAGISMQKMASEILRTFFEAYEQEQK
jgi:hypothetical protein